MAIQLVRTKNVPMLLAELDHLRLSLQTARIKLAAAEADRDRWKRSCEDSWQFAKTIAKTGRMET